MTGRDVPSVSELVIEGRRIAADEPPYVIAEMSANHGGDLDRALKIIELAKEAGADAIKLQAYTATGLTLDTDMPGFVIESESPWKGRTLYELYESACTPYDWFPALFERAKSCGITVFSSAFDADAVNMLEALDAPAYKIASFEAIDYELIEACAATGKPLLISTGMCSVEEIGSAISKARDAGAENIGIFRCNSGYPALIEEANLVNIPEIAAKFGVPVGFSDHTIGCVAAITATALGSCMIEKHFIDAVEPETPDSFFSATPDVLKDLVSGCRQAFAARGRPVFGCSKNESESRIFRRSLYAVKNIRAGEKLTRDNIRCIRPGHGLHPQELNNALGRIASREIKRGEPLSWDIVE